MTSVRTTKGKSPFPKGAPRAVRISVGVHEDRMGQPHGEGLTIGELATVHEFGTGTVPARSFVRAWFDEKQEEAANILKRAVAAAKGNLEQAGRMAALRMAASMQERIANRIAPPLKPATIARKGSDVPLIDQGILRGSLTGRSEVTP
jgi:hypothetical protein